MESIPHHSKETNAHWRSAVDFAKSAARDGTTHVFCPPSLSALPHWPYPVSPPIPDAGLSRPKVSTTLSPLAASPAREGLPLHPPLDVDADSASHHGGAGVRKEMWLNMRKLMLSEESILKKYGVHPPFHGKSIESIWKMYGIHPPKVWNPSPIPWNPSPIPWSPSPFHGIHPPFHAFHME